MATWGGGGSGPLISWRHRIRALVVDDCDYFRTFQSMHLDAFGAETESVATGDAATELINGGKMYDLIVVDSGLPEGTGVQLTRQLRSMGVESKIAAVSVLYTEHEKAAFMEAGADYYIEKMYSFQINFIPILAKIDEEP